MRLFFSVAAAALVPVAAAGGGSPPTLIKTITTGKAPCGAVVAFGSVWVANDGGTLARINPRTNRVTRRIRVGRGSCSLSAGAGALWIANYKQGLIRVLPGGRIRKIEVGGVPFDVLVAYGRVWVTAWEDGKLTVVDPHTLRIVRRLDVGPHPAGLIARNGVIWVGFGRNATAIARVNPLIFRIDRVDVGDRAPAWFVNGGAGDLWIQANDGDVLRFDPIGLKVRARLNVGRTLAQGAVAPGGWIWMPDKEQNLVYRIDPQQERVIDSFPAGPGAYVALRAFGSMWVTSYAGSDVRRFRP
jgi:DNA-binding beta-propeller fold protein YncE